MSVKIGNNITYCHNNKKCLYFQYYTSTWAHDSTNGDEIVMVYTCDNNTMQTIK